ncbi:hypothetical protein HY440_03180 [Candidatus Microgenomates bacterium]|nr:hypothetical protein [Candidatus Microgenomates bacterium]
MFVKNQERYLAVNLVTAANETRPGRPDERISVIPLESVARGICDFLTGQPIESVFSKNDPDSEVNLRMLYKLDRSPEYQVGLWLSPQNEINPKTGKILAAVRQNSRLIIEYDITGDWFKKTDYERFAQQLAKYDQGGYFLLSGDAWSVLPQVIPMPEAWKKILDGRAKVAFEENVDRLLPVVQNLQGESLIDSADRIMASNIRAACPAAKETALVRAKLSPDGRELHYVEKCGKCPYEIKDWIPANFVCPNCGGIYLGC